MIVLPILFRGMTEEVSCLSFFLIIHIELKLQNVLC